MDRFNVRVWLNSDSDHQFGVQQIIERLIAQRGYDSVIINLVNAVHTLAKFSLADPHNRVKYRQFSLWAGGVREAIQRHGESVSESKVTDSDRILARGMGIILD